MTTPSSSPPPLDPEESSGVPPSADVQHESATPDAPPEIPPAASETPAPETPGAPTPLSRETTAPSSEATASAPPTTSTASSSSGPLGFLAAHKMASFAVGGGVAAVIVVIVVLLAMGVFGGGGGGGGGGSGIQSYILDDSDGMFLEIVNVAEILAAPEIPATLNSDRMNSPDPRNYDDPEEWKEDWRDSVWYRGFPIPSWLFEEVALDDVTFVLIQNVDGNEGYALMGNFPFADLRDVMEDEDWEEDTYRDFEVWNDRDVALLEDEGVILLGDDYASAILKAMDTGRGLIDGESTAKRVLDKVGSGMHIWAGDEDCDSFSSLELRGCDGFAMVITGGDVDTTQRTAAFLFSSERRAESNLDDIEEYLLDDEDIDADIERISAEGEFVTYQLTIHE